MGLGLGKQLSPVTPRSPESHSQREASMPSQDQVRTQWLLIAPIKPSGFHSFKGLQTGGWEVGGGGGYWILRRSRLWPKTCPSVGTLASYTIPRGLSPLHLAPHFLHTLRSHCQVVFCSLFLFQVLSYQSALQPSPSILFLRGASSASLPSNYVFQRPISARGTPACQAQSSTEALRLLFLQVPGEQDTPHLPRSRHSMAQPGKGGGGGTARAQ